MKHLPMRECGYAIGFVLAMFLLYGGAYLAMMQRAELDMWGRQMPFTTYRFGDEWSDSFFGLAHELDRRIRPDLWKDEIDRLKQLDRKQALEFGHSLEILMKSKE